MKVDYTYPLNFGELAKKVGAKYFGLLTSSGASSKSRLLYVKTKGLVEEDAIKLDLKGLHIFQPGLLT